MAGHIINAHWWSICGGSFGCRLSPSEEHVNVAFQVFHDSGVLGLLPLPNNEYNLVWSVSLPFYDFLVNLSEHDFLAEVNAKLGSGSGANFTCPPQMTSQVSKRFGFHLTSSSLENFFNGGRVVFLGDSAHTIHPMLGQGLNLGIRDARLLGKALAENLGYGLGLASADGLDRFETEAKLSNYALQAAVEGLKVAYESPWVEDIRQGALGLLENSASVREEMYRVANSI